MQKRLTELNQLLTAYRHSHEIPGLAANVVSKGKVIYSQGFGMTSIDENRSIVTPETIFSIQSITKSFTASALVHLEQETDFCLDAPVVKYLPYFRTKHGPYDQITMRHLLSHTAGFPEDLWLVLSLDPHFYAFTKNMPEYKAMHEQFPKEKIATIQTREDITRYFANVRLVASPGERFAYCSDAYVIASDVLEKVSGMCWEDYVKKHILQPLQMDRTFINPTFSSSENDVADYYLKTIGQSIAVPLPENPLGAPVGYIYSTANDLSTYLIHHMDKSGKWLTTSSLRNMQTALAKREEGLSYGLGWTIREQHDLHVVEHAGQSLGVSSFVAMVPEHQFAIVLLCNTDQIPLANVCKKMIRMWFGS